VLERLAPRAATARLRLFLDYAPEQGVKDVPDPWYGGMGDFERALDLIEAGVEGILRELAR
jgi:protein-tyrosine phosphatase